MSDKILRLSNGVEGLFIKNDRFNTTHISFNFYLPLKSETVANFALLPFILTSCSAKYPDFSRLNYKLAKLYGARLDASTEKYGDFQLLRMTISVINDRYALDDESLVTSAAELLLKLVFEPSVENESFFEADVEREKRKAIEHIKGELSEKRIYAKNRLLEEMYRGENYGIAKCGTVEQVENITGASLFKAWQDMLKSAFVRIHVVGTAVPEGLFEAISSRFEPLCRENVTDCKVSAPTTQREEPNFITERMEIAQGKMVLGFSSELFGNDDSTLPLLVMNDIFGGGPYSRLFTNVREKLSLCYYCSASSARTKGLITVESGVEAENAETAASEILNQLEIIRKGEFDDYEFSSSIKSICDSFKTYNDSQNTLDMWYTLKINNDALYTPDELAEKVSAITREDVIAAAKGVKLHTVYKLLPKETK